MLENSICGLNPRKFDNCVLTNNYVFVIGPDIMLRKEIGEENSEEYIKSILKKEGKDINPINLRGIVESFNAEQCIERINPDIKDLLEAKIFKYVITTTIDPHIEFILRKIWGEELLVYNLFDEANHDVSDEMEFWDKPILYYALGKIDIEDYDNDFAYDDNKRLMAVEKWIKREPTRFLDFLKGKKIIALGCKYDDWLFRLLWYVFVGNINDINNKNGALAISFKEGSDSDDKLRKYLESHDVLLPDVKMFLSKLVDHVKSEDFRNVIDKVSKQIKEGGIFISYAHEDADVAKDLFFLLLQNSKNNVWLDVSRLISGDKYDIRIEHAIRQCKTFIPIISENVLNNLENDNRYFLKEWRIAETVKDKIKIKPLKLQDSSTINLEKEVEKLSKVWKKEEKTGVTFFKGCSFKTEYVGNNNGLQKFIEENLNNK